MRGLLPAEYTYVSKDDFTFRRIFLSEGNVPSKGFWPSGTYGGDGSGGKYTSLPTLRRCGVSLCRVDDGVFSYGI